ncbi:MAG: hypothetical protein ACK4UZ_04005 [Rhizobium rhizophilum]
MGCPIRLQPGSAWEYQGERLRFERELGGKLLHFLVERTLAPLQVPDERGNLVAPDYDWIIQALAEGKLRKRKLLHTPSAARAAAEKLEHNSDEIAALDPRARLRRWVLQQLDEARYSAKGEKGIKAFLKQSWLRAPAWVQAADIPHPRTVTRWMTDRGLPGERPPRQMLSLSGRVERRRQLDPLCQKALERAAQTYWARQYNVLDAYALMAWGIIRLNRIRARRSPGTPPLRIPSYETLRKEIRRTETRETYAAKYGERRADMRFKGTGRGLEAKRILELGCIDHTIFDAVVVIDADHKLPVGRPTLTVLIDVKSRCVVGWVLSFEPPSLFQALEVIKKANRPKREIQRTDPQSTVLANIFGRFDEIVVDNGWEFAGSSFVDALADTGSSVRWAPILSPTYKACVERFFRTLNMLLARKLPGGVLSPETLRLMGYDPYKDAVLTLEELEDLIWRALKLYHLQPHDALHQPPASVWQKDFEAHGVDVIGDDRQLDKMAGRLQYPCQLSRSGVEMFNGLRYHDPAVTEALLEDLISVTPVRQQRRVGSATASVKVKFNPANISEVHVWNERRNLYVTLPCVEEEYARGISLWHHQRLREFSKRAGLAFSTQEDRIKARVEVIRGINKMMPDATIRQRRAMARLKKGPVSEAPLEHGRVAVAFAPDRPDGLAPVVEHTALATSRTDGATPPRGLRRGRKRNSAEAQRRGDKAPAPAAEPVWPERDDDALLVSPAKAFEL